MMITHRVVQEAWKTFSLLDMFAEIRVLPKLHKKQLISIPKHLPSLQLGNLVLKRIIQRLILMLLEIFVLLMVLRVLGNCLFLTTMVLLVGQPLLHLASVLVAIQMIVVLRTKS